MGKKIPKEIRIAVYERDKYVCQLCGDQVILTKDIRTSEDFKKEASLDHIDPSGGDSMGNLQTSCRSCNSRKKDKDERELKFLNLNEGGYTRIHTGLILALARTKLNTQEGRILFAIIAKTYGFNKSEDFVSNSQLETITGMHRAHCANTVTRLKERAIVTKTGNKIKLNKYFFDWRELPKQVTKLKVLPKQVTSVTQTGNQLVPKQVNTKDNDTKDNDTKDNDTKDIEEKITPAQIARNFFSGDYEPFFSSLISAGCPRDLAISEFQRFVDYWTERTKSGKKQLWETKPTFEVGRRLKTWFRNYDKFNPNQKQDEYYIF